MIEMIEIMEMMRRRHRNKIDSPQELALFVVALVIYLIMLGIFKYFFPNVPKKTVSSICTAVMLVVVLVGVFLI